MTQNESTARADAQDAFCFVRCNPQAHSVHPRYLQSIYEQAKTGQVVCGVDDYRITAAQLRKHGYRKTAIRASGNAIIIQAVRQ